MSALSRRYFIGSALTAAAVPRIVAAGAAQAAQTDRRGSRLRVQLTGGDHTSPLQMYAMFEDPIFQDTDPVVLSHPDPFSSVIGPNPPDVIVTNDWITGGWPARERDNHDVCREWQAICCCKRQQLAFRFWATLTCGRETSAARSGSCRELFAKVYREQQGVAFRS